MSLLGGQASKVWEPYANIIIYYTPAVMSIFYSYNFSLLSYSSTALSDSLLSFFRGLATELDAGSCHSIRSYESLALSKEG